MSVSVPVSVSVSVSLSVSVCLSLLKDLCFEISVNEAITVQSPLKHRNSCVLLIVLNGLTDLVLVGAGSIHTERGGGHQEEQPEAVETRGVAA